MIDESIEIIGTNEETLTKVEKGDIVGAGFFLFDWLFGGGGRNGGAYNCQQWADKKMNDCQKQCKAK